MKYWSKNFFVFLSFIMTGNAFCQSNPFNAVFNLKSQDSIDDKNVLIIGVASEKNDGKYKLMIDTDGSSITFANGNEVFTGKAGSAVRQEHYLPFEITKEGEGGVSARLYTFTDSMDVDASSRREFFIKYTVKKRSDGAYDVILSEVKEKHGQDLSSEANAASTGSLTITDMKEVVGSSLGTQQDLIDQENPQKFIINTQKRYNGFLRGLLLIFSFVILGYLCYRILNKK
jgi:hypothetical protein